MEGAEHIMSTNTESNAVVKSTFTDEWMAGVVRAEGMTLDSLAKAFQAEGTNGFDDAGDGIFNVELIEDKDFLRDLPFFITRWRFNTSDKFKSEDGEAGEFVSVEIAYQTSPEAPLQTGVFNDGSTGVMAQLKKITEARLKSGVNDPYAGRAVRRGLRRSDYMRDTGRVDKKGEPIMEGATTYYLNI